MSWSSFRPFWWFGPLLISQVAAIAAAALEALLRFVEDLPKHRAKSFKEFVMSEQGRPLFKAALEEAVFASGVPTGFLGFSIWALSLPLEGSKAFPEVQSATIVLLLIAVTLMAVMRYIEKKYWVVCLLSGVGLCVWILFQYRVLATGG